MIAELIRKGATYGEIHDITKIDKFHIHDICHVLRRQRLKIQFISHVKIGAYRFGG